MCIITISSPLHSCVGMFLSSFTSLQDDARSLEFWVLHVCWAVNSLSLESSKNIFKSLSFLSYNFYKCHYLSYFFVLQLWWFVCFQDLDHVIYFIRCLACNHSQDSLGIHFIFVRLVAMSTLSCLILAIWSFSFCLGLSR